MGMHRHCTSMRQGVIHSVELRMDPFSMTTGWPNFTILVYCTTIAFVIPKAFQDDSGNVLCDSGHHTARDQ